MTAVATVVAAVSVSAGVWGAAAASGAPGSVSAGAPAASRTAVRLKSQGRQVTRASASTDGVTGQAAGLPGRSSSSSSGPAKMPKVRSASRAKPYLIYDSILPGALPPGYPVAVYATGPYPASPAQVAGRGQVLWIDVTGTDPGAQVLDIEPGCATPSWAPTWVSQRLSAQPGALAILYTSRSEWPEVQAAVAALPAWMIARIRWWIADPTGYPHLVPGSDATQWYWGSSYDISTASPRL